MISLFREGIFCDSFKQGIKTERCFQKETPVSYKIQEYKCIAEHLNPFTCAGLKLNHSGPNLKKQVVTPAGNLAGNMLAGFINSASLDKSDHPVPHTR